jgi:uncharacterized damage-inducible protein DinB
VIARAQTMTPAAAAKRSYDEAANWVVKSAEMVPEAKYSFKATKDVRSFAQLVAHLVDGQNYYCSAATKKTQWTDPAEKALGTKAQIVAKLKKAVADCDAAYSNSAANIAPLIENVGHTNLHYGNVITYMRLMGMVPPSSAAGGM